MLDSRHRFFLVSLGLKANAEVVPNFPQVATTCFSCSPPYFNLVVTNVIFCIHVKQPLPPGIDPIAVNKYYYYYYYYYFFACEPVSYRVNKFD
jgi:hypothetical protein